VYNQLTAVLATQEAVIRDKEFSQEICITCFVEEPKKGLQESPKIGTKMISTDLP
jgi:hypothetical protein